MSETPDIDALIQSAAQGQDLPPELLRALISQESSFNPQAKNASGASGLGQLMPATAKRLGVTDPTDPTQAIPAAARYLREGIDASGGDIRQGLMYYYGGPDQRLWGPKTQAYPGQVLARLGGSAAPDSFPERLRGWGQAIEPDYSGPSFRRMIGDTFQSAADMLERSAGQTPPGQPSMGNVLANPTPEALAPILKNSLDLSGAGIGAGATAPVRVGGMFAGLGSKTVQDAMEAAAALEKPQQVERFVQSSPILSRLDATGNFEDNPSLESNESMWRSTGWFTGPDGHLRYEIPDFDAALKSEGLRDAGSGYVAPKAPLVGEAPTYLGDILHHPQLFEAYPQLSAIEIRPTGLFDGLRGIQGSMDASNGIMRLSSAKSEDMLSTVLHETQHYIQYLEGWARGGNASEFLPEGFETKYAEAQKRQSDVYQEARQAGANPFSVEYALRAIARGENPIGSGAKDLNKLPPDLQRRFAASMLEMQPLDATKNEAFSAYKHLAGEVESRNVEARRAQSETGFPLSTQGYPTKPQIVLGQGQVAPRLAPPENSVRLAPVDHNPWLQPVENDPFQ